MATTPPPPDRSHAPAPPPDDEPRIPAMERPSDTLLADAEERADSVEEAAAWEAHSNLDASGSRSLSPTALAVRRLLANKLAVASLVYVVLLLLAAVVGPEVWRHRYNEQNFERVLQAPSLAHPFGTDQLGRDLLANTLMGARISLVVGLFASLIALGIGVLYGGIAGYAGGRLGRLMMRAVDVIYGIPLLLIVIMLIIVAEGSATDATGRGGDPLSRMKIIFIAMGITFWLPMARVVRAKVLALKEMEFALAARAGGAGHGRILLRHLMPNALGPIIVMVTLNIPEAIFAEAFLSYIGLGITAPMASWGTLAAEGARFIRSDHVHLLLFPALAISSTMLAFNFLGDGLRDAFDPQQKD